MRKLTAIMLMTVLLLSLAACGKKDTATGSDAASTQPAPTDGIEVVVDYDENGKPVTEIIPTSGSIHSTTDPMSEVTVVIPYNYIYSLDEKYQNDLQLYCTDNGFTSVTADEAGGTVTLIMTAATHNALLSAKRAELSQIFISLINTYPFFDQCIPGDNSYTDVTVRVDREAYESDDSAAVIIDYIGSLCMNSYQIFLTSTDYHCTVRVVDKDTGDTIEEFNKTSVFSN